MASKDERTDIGSALSSLSAALSQLSSAVVSQTGDELNARVTDPLRRATEQITDVADRLGNGSDTRRRGMEATREALLDAAAQLFAEKGYEGTGVSEIARLAGYTKGALYANFASKEQLFRALIERESLRSSESLDSLIHGPGLDSTEGGSMDNGGASQRDVLLWLEVNLYAIRHPEARDEVLATVDERLRRLAVAIARANGDMARWCSAWDAPSSGESPEEASTRGDIPQRYLDAALTLVAVESYSGVVSMLAPEWDVEQARDRIISGIVRTETAHRDD